LSTEQQNNVDASTVWTPANIVTLTRICLIPIFVVALLSPWPQYFPQSQALEIAKPIIATIIFIILAATDAVDGYLARSRGEVTNFGKFMDPLADKILVAAALLALVQLDVLPSWVVLIILTREFIVSGIRMVAAAEGQVIAASWYGKAKTVFQIIAIVLFLIKDSPILGSIHVGFNDWLYVLSWFFMIIALALTIISLVDYFVKSKDLLGFGPSRKFKSASHVSKNASATTIDSDHVFLTERTSALAEEVLEMAREQGRTIATAESCTGGLVSAALSSVPGSSDVLLGSVVSYANSVKTGVLHVSDLTLDTVGAVSKETACQMAHGARRRLKADIAVSLTGIAGPGGAVEGKPVGTVWIGVDSARINKAREFHFEGSRNEVREQACYYALRLFKRELTRLAEADEVIAARSSAAQ